MTDLEKENAELRKKLEALEKKEKSRTEKLRKALSKPVTIRGTTYENKEEAAKALGVSPYTIKWARINGKLDVVGLGKSNIANISDEEKQKNIAKRQKTIFFQGTQFQGWAEATHVTGMSRRRLLRRGAKVV